MVSVFNAEEIVMRMHPPDNVCEGLATNLPRAVPMCGTAKIAHGLRGSRLVKDIVATSKVRHEHKRVWGGRGVQE